ncbi:MAG: hypothetical protein EXR24_07120, partial [Ignavibacteria bacterium]|nr:hypothetical protein [Ignavibacteria bacterium]
MIKSLALLYKQTTTGKTQTWEIQVEADKFRTISGQLNGKLITNEWTVCNGKNIGQSNETSPSDQALKEAEAKITKKLETGYSNSLTNVGRAKYFEPMLAHKFGDYESDLTYPVASQPKLDGIRCIITKDGMSSRNGKPIASAPHIFESLREFFLQHPTIVLDGELYNHDLKKDFNKIVSLAKRTKPTSEDLKESEKMIQYWIYDMLDLNQKNETFSERFINLKLVNPFNKYCIEVPTLDMQNEDALD